MYDFIFSRKNTFKTRKCLLYCFEQKIRYHYHSNLLETFMKMKTKELVQISMFASLIAIFAQITIPIPIVPITGQTLAVGLTATVLSTKRSVQAVMLYLLLGAIGLPVYAGFNGGIGVLFGPTGGYLLSFPIMALLIGLFIKRNPGTFLNSLVANNIGMVVQLLIGCIWLKFSANYSWEAAFNGGFISFIPVGILKAVIASWIGLIIRQRLLAAQILSK